MKNGYESLSAVAKALGLDPRSASKEEIRKEFSLWLDTYDNESGDPRARLAQLVEGIASKEGLAFSDALERAKRREPALVAEVAEFYRRG